MKYFVFLFGLSGLSTTFSQSGNLVPNASFEEYKTLPSDIAQGRKCIKDWKIPNTIGAGDYYNIGCSTKKAGVPKNHFGQQVPRTGRAYMGICITKHFWEFLQVELRAPLVKDSEYRVEFYISCGDRIGLSTVNEFNVLFSEESFSIPNNEDLLVVPDLTITGDFKNKKEWVKLSAIYTARGNEKVLTFGCFTYKEKGVNHGKIHGFSKYAHYYVDDVSITLVNHPEKIDANDTLPNNLGEDISEAYQTGQTYIFDKLLFESGKSVLLNTDYPELDNLIHYLKSKTQYTLLITGHTDNVGDKDMNKKLSHDRANSVKQYLIENGINADAISIEGKGDNEPLMSNDTEEGRKANRRVEISIIQ